MPLPHFGRQDDLRLWLTEPVYVPRWGLLLKYAWLVAAGITGIVFGSRTLERSSTDGYTLLWAIGLTVFAAVAIIGVAHRRIEGLEALGAFMSLTFIAVLLLQSLLTDGSPLFITLLAGSVSIPISRLPFLIGRVRRAIAKRIQAR